jgi:hypothetical protein
MHLNSPRQRFQKKRMNIFVINNLYKLKNSRLEGVKYDSATLNMQEDD